MITLARQFFQDLSLTSSSTKHTNVTVVDGWVCASSPEEKKNINLNKSGRIRGKRRYAQWYKVSRPSSRDRISSQLSPRREISCVTLRWSVARSRSAHTVHQDPKSRLTPLNGWRAGRAPTVHIYPPKPRVEKRSPHLTPRFARNNPKQHEWNLACALFQ